MFVSVESGAVSDRPGTAVVTGASSGIGDEYAARLAAGGYDLVLVARRTHRLVRLADRLRKDHNVAVEELTADLAVPADVAKVAQRVASADVTLLVNNAGINGYGPFSEVDAQLQARVVAVNVTAPTMLARAALPGMVERGRGAIINVSSLLAFSGDMPSRQGLGERYTPPPRATSWRSPGFSRANWGPSHRCGFRSSARESPPPSSI
jgi:hypothetical protein